MTMLWTEPSAAKRFCSSTSLTKPRRFMLKRDQRVPSRAVHIETCPWRAAPPLEVIVHTFASAGGFASCSTGVCAKAGETKKARREEASMRIIIQASGAVVSANLSSPACGGGGSAERKLNPEHDFGLRHLMAK